MILLRRYNEHYETTRRHINGLGFGSSHYAGGSEGFGGAAHLAGVVAAHTALPVIGVPIMNKTAAGVDALFATVQMPPGIPVATVAINGAKNAGILAAQIIGTGDTNILKNVGMYKEKMAKDVVAKDEKLQEKGFKKYLEEQGLI